MNQNRGHRRFRRLGRITLVAVYILILVGGIVRSTGSGMGCPDWPKCFGNWVPPTDVSQLPSDYKEVYAQKRAKKNDKFANYLDFFGFKKKADEIRHDESILVEAEFNKYRTWTEYFNRLTGATIGLLVILTLWGSLVYWKSDKTIVYLSFSTLVLVIFEGWIGSIVVSTRLMPWIITLHMMLALVIVAFLIYAVYRANDKITISKSIQKRSTILKLLLVSIFAYLIQVELGTEVREMIDVVAEEFAFQMRNQWIDLLGLKFYIHRSYSLVILLLHVYLLVLLFQHAKGDRQLMSWSKVLVGIIVLEILTGVIMAYFAIPAFAQPIHLLLASIIFGIQVYLFLLVRDRKAATAAIEN
ncbi:COX15/CtaA family protein [Xanthovirga aplysinae]|uniref:COX15/CtaA family protein n=1 Tax=Xanthovirga aplysinae TaxID=2529853 RepID=UPI0012BC7F37|nr:COX15/CtaA family protein [Xanthovirga aplysinae]MTI33279.1 heme A synthase [Xanthovirga aplysinae]